MLSGEQRGALRGLQLGVLITIGAFLLGRHSPLLQPAPGAPPLAMLRWDLLPALCLAAQIGIIARHRFLTPEDLPGSGLSDATPRLRLYRAQLQNTLEQTVLTLITHLLWAVTMPPARLGAIAVAALLFVIGRILFWRGYAAGAPGRALGFALTFYPSVGMLVGVGSQWVWPH